MSLLAVQSAMPMMFSFNKIVIKTMTACQEVFSVLTHASDGIGVTRYTNNFVVKYAAFSQINSSLKAVFLQVS